MQITLHDGGKAEGISSWNAALDAAPLTDVYYRPGYARAHQQAGHGIAVALEVTVADQHALLPLLLRDIGGVRDAITPYGYGGLIRLSGPLHRSREQAEALFDVLRGWARDQQLVSLYLRLHPLLDQGTRLSLDTFTSELLHVHHDSVTTSVDLSAWDEPNDCLAGMSRGRYSDLAAARQRLSVTIAETREALRDVLPDFRQIYSENMDRLRASPFYYFSAGYFSTLIDELPGRVMIALAKRQDVPVAAAMFFADRDFGHYHLAGATLEGRNCKATTLLVSAGAGWARQRGCTQLHLGGGVQPNDKLFGFKSSFGGRTHPYICLTLVADAARFQELTQSSDAPWPYARERAETAENPLMDVVAAAPRVPIAVANGSEQLPALDVPKGITPVVGLGAGGHAKVLLDILACYRQYQCIGLLEVRESLFGETLQGIRILGDEELLGRIAHAGIATAFIGIGGIGDNTPRARLFERVTNAGLRPLTLIHPSATVSSAAKIGAGTVIMAGAVVNAGATIGDNVIVNSGAIVEHDCIVADHAHIAPGAVLSGGVIVERYAHIGTGAAVRQGLRVGEAAIVGMGAAVVRDVPAAVTVVGVPARQKRARAAAVEVASGGSRGRS